MKGVIIQAKAYQFFYLHVPILRSLVNRLCKKSPVRPERWSLHTPDVLQLSRVGNRFEICWPQASEAHLVFVYYLSVRSTYIHQWNGQGQRPYLRISKRYKRQMMDDLQHQTASPSESRANVLVPLSQAFPSVCWYAYDGRCS